MNVVDSLVVTLGLDTSDYLRNSKTARDEIRRVLNESGSAARAVEADGKRAASFVRGLRNETVGLVLAFAGANSIKDFAANIIGSDAATKRLADNLGVATARLSAWQSVARANGGSSQDANAAFSGIAGAYQSYQLTGSTGHDADFQGLGVSLVDLKNGPDAVLMRMAAASERMTRPEFVARLQRIGIPDSVINSLARGQAETQRLVREQERLGTATDESGRQSVEFEKKLADLQTAIVGAARPALLGLVDGLLGVTKQVDLANVGTPILAGGLAALAIPAFAMAAPFIAWGVAIAGVTYAIDEMLKRNPALTSFLDDAEAPLRKWLGPNFAWLFKRPGDSAGTAPPAAGGGRGGPAYRGGGYEAYFRSQGFTAEQARGIAAGIGAEGGTPTAVNPTSKAFGIGQWLGPRKAALFAKYGAHPTEAQQLEFLTWELRGGDAGGPSVGRQGSAGATARAYLQNFMRPGAGLAGDLSRANALLGGGVPRGPSMVGGGGGNSSSLTIGSIVVNTAATDAHGVARDLRGAIASRGLVRQADTGMRQ